MADPNADPDALVLSAADTGWLGKNRPGTLTLASGRLRFETADGVEFDVPAGELEKPAFSAKDSVFKVVADGRKYRFYFGERVGMVDDFELDEGLARGVRGFEQSRATGSQLKAALGL